MIEMTPEVRDAVFACAIGAQPIEACGLLSTLKGSVVIDEFHPVRNSAESSTVFVLDPQQMLDVERRCEERGRSTVAVMHSHVDSSPYPSPTDVSDSAAYDPDGFFSHIIVSLRHAEPILRGYRVVDGVISEEFVAIREPEPTAHDQATAVAAVVSLRKPKPKPAQG